MLTSEARVEGTPPARRFRGLRTVEEVFDVVGGKHAMRELTAQKYTTVCNWLALYKRFPPRFYLRIQNHLKREGYIADPGLFGME